MQSWRSSHGYDRGVLVLVKANYDDDDDDDDDWRFTATFVHVVG